MVKLGMEHHLLLLRDLHVRYLFADYWIRLVGYIVLWSVPTRRGGS